MDLDFDELEATRNKSADKMFEELGYARFDDLDYSTRYIKNTKYPTEGETIRESIEFMFERHWIAVEIFSFKTGLSFRKILTTKELKAINKKVEELRMVESRWRYGS